MTKDSNKELTDAKHIAVRELIEIGDDYGVETEALEKILQWHKSECKRFALECVEDCVYSGQTMRSKDVMIKNIGEKIK